MYYRRKRKKKRGTPKIKGVVDRSMLKKAVWGWASKWCRLSESDRAGICQCVTCGSRHHWKQMDAGHFIPGHHESIFLDTRNFHAQCASCNRFRQGAWPQYMDWMEKTYGHEVIDELRLLNKTISVLTVERLKELKEYFKLAYLEECKLRNIKP